MCTKFSLYKSNGCAWHISFIVKLKGILWISSNIQPRRFKLIRTVLGVRTRICSHVQQPRIPMASKPTSCCTLNIDLRPINPLSFSYVPTFTFPLNLITLHCVLVWEFPRIHFFFVIFNYMTYIAFWFHFFIGFFFDGLHYWKYQTW